MNRFLIHSKKLSRLPRVVKRLIVISLDVSLVFLSLWLALAIRLETFSFPINEILLLLGIQAAVLYVCINYFLGLYRVIFRYSGSNTIYSLVKASLFYAIIFGSGVILYKFEGVPRSVGVLQPIFLVALVLGSRLSAHRFFVQTRIKSIDADDEIRALIYGAGSAGRQLAINIQAEQEIRCLGFFDDDKTLQNNSINGLRVYSPESINKIIQKHAITDIFLAMPSVKRYRKNEIIHQLASLPVKVKTIPGMTELATGKVKISDIRDLELDDVLGREPIPPNQVLLNNCIRGKKVLITGAGGSIGSELCRQVLECNPRLVILIEHSEIALYEIEKELLETNSETKVIPLMADVKDNISMGKIFKKYVPETVFHAAAYKHVPIVEKNPVAGITNNVIGTYNVLQESIEVGANRFILISTDKAVRPTNIMGASKRMAEMIVQSFSKKEHNTICSMVRFGNVIGSSGSVVPLFRNQIKSGGPITLTHKDVTRFFMSISEAAQLVIQAGAMAKGGEVFLLDMGEPVKIYDLAVRMIRLSGLTLRDDFQQTGDIEIKVTGLRPGEKLYEELLIDADAIATSHPLIMQATENCLSLNEVKQMIDQVYEICRNQYPNLEMEKTQILSLLKTYVEGYTHDQTQGAS